MSKGSSLLELLIAVVLTVVVAVITTSLLFTTLGGSGKASGLVLVKQNGDQAIQLIEREIREARRAECPGGNTLLLNDLDPDQITFSLNSDRITQTPGGFLTSSGVEATIFGCSKRFGVGGEPDVIDINFTLVLAPGGRPSETVSEDFETSVSLRTYE